MPKRLPEQPSPPEPELLARIDQALGELSAGMDLSLRRRAVLALTSLRRNLFPAAPAYPVEAA